MTAIELKTQINNALNDIPEAVLVDILDLVNEVKLSSIEDPKFVEHLKTILTEDKELLRKLAE